VPASQRGVNCRDKKEWRKMRRYEFKATINEVDIQRIVDENMNDETKAFVIVLSDQVIVCIDYRLMLKLTCEDRVSVLGGMPLHLNWGSRKNWGYNPKTNRIEGLHCDSKLVEIDFGVYNFKIAEREHIPQIIDEINNMFSAIERKYSKKHKVSVLTW
jgi:hypothetical protein